MGADLNLLHPYVKYLCLKHIAACAAKGLKIMVTDTYRSIAEQAKVYAQGRTTPGPIISNAEPGWSMHNYHLAYDIAIVNPDGKTINWSDICDTDHDGIKDYYEAGAIGESIGLVWGGHFKNITDKPHYQWTNGLSIEELRAGRLPTNPLDQKATVVPAPATPVVKPEPTPAIKTKVVTSSSGLFVREKADKNSRSIFLMNCGSKVEILGTSGIWDKIKFGTIIGWACNTYLK